MTMQTHQREVIGSFTVVDNKQEIKKVLVCQDILNHYSADSSHFKSLYLDHVDGVEVYKTNDPEIFKLPDGTTLKKKSR